MWLIDTSTLKLVFHPTEPLNGYMILSHTWEDGEVTFQDLQNVEFARTKKGFSKIEETCRLAREATLEWAWVDTCCIDKTSSAELSEAINSMYRWYQRAATCCAYLSDLPPLDYIHLPNCRWFTRGWTLQELLAPSKITFYDNKWNLRVSKQSLRDPISAITGIDVLALTGSRSLEDYPIAVRMAWCSKRQTARPEDLAYCLLGIFGVYMPMLYGEGANAFLRLQEEICKNIDDLSIFAWKRQYEADIPSRNSGFFADSPRDFSACHLDSESLTTS
ncbi:heterokaryon incompatibility protein-domain-containing protein [Xylaria arbuscula]|nr:heterokaryon incompatibility protein-domain-containing protein [Xylaria arbuscula]